MEKAMDRESGAHVQLRAMRGVNVLSPTVVSDVSISAKRSKTIS